MKRIAATILTAIAVAFVPAAASAEILAMLNYESKPADTLKAMKLTGPKTRQEGIAIIDVDPKSSNFGKILMDVPLPSDLVAHHIFFDRNQAKAYVTALGKSQLHVFKMDEFPYRLKRIDLPDCKMGEDVVFSPDNKKWYMTCMASERVIVGDVATDKVTNVFKIPNSFPHGLVVNDDINRILVTSTISGDLKTPHEDVIVLEASTGKVLSRKKVSTKKSPSGVAPVELLWVTGANPPVAYVTNMFGGTIWSLSWNPKTKDFDTSEVVNFGPTKSGVPLEMYFTPSGNTMYATTANPGKFHIFDMVGGPMKPKLVKTLPMAEGAHHVAFTKDFRYGIVQNSFINLPGMSDGAIIVVDLKSQKAVATIDTLKNKGLNPNCIVLLPKWNHLAGH